MPQKAQHCTDKAKTGNSETIQRATSPQLSAVPTNARTWSALSSRDCLFVDISVSHLRRNEGRSQRLLPNTPLPCTAAVTAPQLQYRATI